jgi:hypothetical protein
MKKFFTLSILLVSGLIFMPSAEAKTNNAGNAAAANAAEPQVTIQLGQNRRNRRMNNRRAVRTVTRNVRRGRVLYRETYRVTYRPNGTTTTRLISRVRVGRY